MNVEFPSAINDALQLLADNRAIVGCMANEYAAAVRQHAVRNTQLSELIKRQPGSPAIPGLKEVQRCAQKELGRHRADLDQAIAALQATETRIRQLGGASFPPPSLKVVC
jgi:hypothetical protein